MVTTLKDFSKKNYTYEVSGCTRPELESKVALFMNNEGYKQKKVEGDTVTYEKGNRIMRILFGAFAKYHKQLVSVGGVQEPYLVDVARSSSGMSGGAIGMAQVRKEFERLNEGFRQYMG